MKRFLAVVSILLVVFTLVSCGNLTLSVNTGKTAAKQAATGKIIIKMPLSDETERTALAIKQTVDQVTSIDIMLDNPEAPENNRSKINATRDELEAGIAFVVNPGSYNITIRAYKGSYSEGTRVILYEGKTGNSDPAVVAAGDTVSKTIDMQKYFILYDNGPEAGDNRFILAKDYIYQGTSLELVYVAYDSYNFPSNWMVSGKVITGWKDPEGNEYERGQVIPLGGKQLPLVLTAIWADPTVTYSFNGNVESLTSDGSSMTTFSKEGERYSSFYVPAYSKEEIPNCAEDADETYRRGVFNDNNMTQNADESWQRDFDGGPYYFCGWSVNEKIDTIETINIDSLRTKLQSVEIVQPGQEISLKYDDTVFYAVWANAALADSGEIWKISYELGEAESAAYAKKYMYYLTDTFTDYPSEEGKKKFRTPALMGIFPQVSEYGSINIYDYWYEIDNQGAEIEDSSTGQGGDFIFNVTATEKELRFRYKVDMFSLVFLRDASDENEYSPSWDIIGERRTHAYPVNLTGMTLPTYAQIKEEYPDSHDGAQMPEPDDGTVFLKWLWMDSDRENNPWGLTELTYLEDGHEFTDEEAALVKNSGMELPLVAVYGEDPRVMNMIDVTGRSVSEPSDSGAFAAATADSPVVIKDFSIAETELTYAQWYDVYTWATSAEREAEGKRYVFANKGRQGSEGLTNEYGNPGYDGCEPVNLLSPATNMSWRDAVVWCNAASEKAGLAPVYYYFESGVTQDFSNPAYVLRQSQDSSISAGSGKAEKAVINPAADGYRLPTNDEWEFAARGADPDDGYWLYPYAGSNDPAETVVYYENAEGSTANVKSKAANSIGLYDMCGNVSEYVWDIPGNISSTNRIARGGDANSRQSNEYYSLDYSSYYDNPPTSYRTQTGFRVVRGSLATPISSLYDITSRTGCYYLAEDFTVDYWSERLFPDESFDGQLYGNGKTITFNEASNPIFHDVGSSCVIDGITIDGYFNYPSTSWASNGVLCLTINGTVRNCNFIGNVGGVVNSVFGAKGTGCVVDNNTAPSGLGVGLYQGD